MEYIELNSDQFSNLVENKILKLKDDNVLLLHQNDIMLCHDSKVYEKPSFSLNFSSKLYSPDDDTNYVRELVCEYFNFKINEVIPIWTKPYDEYMFKIIFSKDIFWELYVCSYETAKYNTRDVFEMRNIKYKKGDINIGPYRKLASSDLFFRRINYDFLNF